MGRANVSITGNLFGELARRIDKAGGDLKAAVDEALTESSSVFQNEVRHGAAAYAHGGRKGYATGEMYKAILPNQRPIWVGDSIAYIKGGYDLKKQGGFHSIFVMYGTPRYAKDQKVWASMKGNEVRTRIANMQKLIMQRHLDISGGGK